MDDIKISNSIYLSAATLEIILILLLKANSSIAYYHGLVWCLPIALISIPVYRCFQKLWIEKINEQQAPQFL